MRAFIIPFFPVFCIFIGSSYMAGESQSETVISEQRQNEYLIERDLSKAIMSWLIDGNQPAALECDKLADSLLATGEPTVRAYFYATKVANLRQQPNKAIAILEEVITKYPEERTPRGPIVLVKIAGQFWIATIYKQSGDITMAKRSYEKILTMLEGMENNSGLTMMCNIYLAEIESKHLKNDKKALSHLMAISEINKPEGLGGAGYDLYKSWAGYESIKISKGKDIANQQLTSVPEAMSAYMLATNHFFLSGMSGEPISGSYKGLNIVTEILVNRTIQNNVSQIDKDLARLAYGYDQQYKMNYEKAEKYLSSLFQDDSFFSPIAGVYLAFSRKAQNKGTEAEEILKQVIIKYPGYDSLVMQVRELWNKEYEL